MATNVDNLSSKTLFVGNLPYSTTNVGLENIFSDIGPIKQCFVVKDRGSDKCKGFGYVTFSVREDADKAKNLHPKLEGRKLHVSLANKKVRVVKNKKDKTANVLGEDDVKDDAAAGQTTEVETELETKTKKMENVNLSSKRHGRGRDMNLRAQWKGRLIVRNLSFKCNQDELLKAFKKFGEIQEVKIPTKPDGKMFGFGFVHFKTMNSANIAVQKMNGKEILGRVVAVDWAVPKGKYTATVKERTIEKIEENVVEAGDDEMQSDSESDQSSFSDDGKTTENADKDDDDSSSDSMTDEEVDDDNDDDSDEGFSDDDDDDSDNDEIESKKQLPAKPVKSDVGEEKTLFVRNISFDTEEEDLSELFSQFGEIEFCRLVMDPNTEHSKGMAFVKFKNKDDAAACLLKAEEKSDGDEFFLDNRPLNVIMAVSREKAAGLKKEKTEKQPKDNRNLFLAREGMIRPGSQAAEGLSKIDLDKRMKVDQLKRQKLKNPQVFISTTRICVRNLPATISDKEVRKAFLKVVNDKSAQITECRVMRDLNRLNSQGVGKSKGYAFVDFSDHQHALKALREANNNALFGENKRLIVEFSLENKSALQLKAKRLERINANKNRFLDKSQRLPKNQHKTNRGSDKVKPMAAPPMKASASIAKLGKGLPSHSGPKIRHNTRPSSKLVKPSKNKAKPITDAPKEKKKKTKRKNREKTDDFDSLVNKHKQKLIGAMSHKQKAVSKSKWFD